MSTARHFYYACMLEDLITTHFTSEKLRFLEIGAGAGNLATILSHLGMVECYTIIDLPDMLVNSLDTTATHLPEATLTFGGAKRVARKPRFRFLAPQQASEILPASVDVVINANSFMEMDQYQLEEYFDLIYRVSRSGALFFNVNRRQARLPQRDGSKFDNNPLLYPYRSVDRVLRWELDAFQQDTRCRFGECAQSYAILRAALVNCCGSGVR